MFSIASDIKTLENIKSEIKVINSEIKRLRQKSKSLHQLSSEINARIVEYCHSKNQPGFKYNGKALIVTKKPSREAKKTSDRERDAIEVLRSKGVQNPEILYREIMEARRGDIVEKDDIIVKTIDTE